MPSPTEGSLTRVLTSSILVLLLAACGSHDAPMKDASAMPMSLIEHWANVRIEEPTPPPAAIPKAEVRFDDTGLAGVRWSAIEGVADLRLENGRLVGRSTTTAPMILLEVPEPLGTGDELWSVKISLRASAGSRLGVHPMRDPGPPMPVVVGRAEAWPLASPLVAGDESQTYSVVLDRVFTLEMPMAETDVSRIMVRPTNVSGADFAIESVQLIFRREYLASISSGPGWHGLGEVFRETVVARSPETLAFEVTLPERPWLDLSVGTIEQPAPVFRVAIAPSGGESEVLTELEVASADSWQPARVDLGPWAGQTVEVRLSATAEAAGTLALWGAPTIRSSVAGGDRPQAVIVFLADTLRSDRLDAWGHNRETAPTLSRLAAEGVRFEDAIAQATWTKVSVSSMLTSLYPATTGVADLNDRVAAAETTLAEAFRAAGYATFATSSVPFSGQLTNLHQGVEVLYEFGARSTGDGEYQAKTAKVWVDRFLTWLELHHDVPVFAFIHAMDPHSPFRPAAPFDSMWTEPGGAERYAEQSARLEPHIENPLLRRFMAPTREELTSAGVDEASFVAHEQAWYDGSIRGLDTELGRLMDRLGELGLADDTLLAFVADHGEEFLEHGRHWHGQSVYGEVANVPLVLWGRGVPAGKVVEKTVQNLDVMPTLLDLAGIPLPERAQGRSLVPLWSEAGEERPRPAFTEHRVSETDGPDLYDSFAMVEGRFKLIWNVGVPAGVAEYELYDHSEDPLDLHDIAAEHPDVVERLRGELERWRTWAESHQLAADAATEMSADELERLRSLGYL